MIKLEKGIYEDGWNHGIKEGIERGRTLAKKENMKEIEFAIRRTKERTLVKVIAKLRRQINNLLTTL